MTNTINSEILPIEDWKFSLINNNSFSKDLINSKIKAGLWYNACVPGTIHTDLLNNKLIDDPFYADNELKMEWISKCDWIFKTEFELTDKKNYNLVLEGIDTIADVYLNDTKILSCKNMFLAYQIDVNKYLKTGKNELRIFFHSPVNYALKEEKKYGVLQVALSSYRAYIRKAQYSFGWDWGPSFPTSGIWRKIYLEEKVDVEIKNVLFTTKSITGKNAKVIISADVKTGKSGKYKVSVKLSNSKKIIQKEVIIKNDNTVSLEVNIPEPQLWWPNGEGEQNLYDLILSVTDKDNVVIQSVKKKVGIRTIELMQKERNKNTFKLRINKRDIFAKGVNWIPADSFLTRVEKDKYSKLLSYAKDANMNIVRVWGGGIYENDEFYNLCDELGLLVWQDFMFACGAYPEHKEFIENVKDEVKQNVERLQHHVSIAVWCGNNENEWMWYQDQKTSYKKMPGYKIYNNVIPEILKKIDPSLCYWESSPFSNEEDPNSFESGNTHQWDIWSRWIDYENVKYDRSLFVTEFGFQGPANRDTLEKVLPKGNRKINDRLFEFHNKQVEGPERVMKFLSSHLPVNTNWEDFIYLAQLNQGFALKTCLEHWRTNGRTNGSIIWQINDCWPVTSWAIIDSELKPKLAYHFVKNIFSQQIVYFLKDKDVININVQNQNAQNFTGKIRLNIIDAESGNYINEISRKVTIAAGQTKTTESIPAEEIKGNRSIIITASLSDTKDNVLSSNYYKELPWKHLTTAKAKINISIGVRNNVKQVMLKTNKPAYFVDLYAPGVTFSKRGFLILPGEEICVNISGENAVNVKAGEIKTFLLNDYL